MSVLGQCATTALRRVQVTCVASMVSAPGATTHHTSGNVEPHRGRFLTSQHGKKNRHPEDAQKPTLMPQSQPTQHRLIDDLDAQQEPATHIGRMCRS